MRQHAAWIALVLLFAFTFTPAFAQDTAGLGMGHAGNLFLEASTARTGQGSGFIWGGSAGAYLQGRLLGFVARATALPGNATTHAYSAVLGPRIAVSLPLFRAYLEAGGGYGRSDGYNSGYATGSSWGPAWQVDVGVEHTLLPHLDWRILELAYGHIYAGPGLAPTVLSTGLTVHFW